MKFKEFKNKIKAFPVFSTAMLPNLTKRVATLKVQLTSWKQKELILPLRRGLYVLNQEDRSIEPSNFYLANQIFIPSYVSLESALSYYGLIPEFVPATTSVTSRKTSKFKNAFGVFTYQHVKSAAYGGFQSLQEPGKMPILIATPEKAVADFIYLNLEKFHPADKAVFKTSYRFQNCEALDSKTIKLYSKIFETKKLSVILDLFIRECVR